MRIYVFKSETRQELHAFAGDPGGSKLPKQHGPWTATGIVAAERAPPYNFSRDAIEESIEGEGFQLWRFSKKPKSAERQGSSPVGRVRRLGSSRDMGGRSPR